MALDNLLEVYDENGVKQDYDILADDVKFSPDGKDLPTKLAEMQTSIDDAGQVDEIIMNGEHYTPTNKVIDLGTVITQHQDISGKVDKEQGKGLSTNDYTTEDKTKLAGLPTNPVQSISVNGTAQSKDTNGNVNVVVPTLTLDNEPTEGSQNAVKSGGVKQAIDDKLTEVVVNEISGAADIITIDDADLAFTDEDGNIAMQVAEGHVETQHFDSRQVATNTANIQQLRSQIGQQSSVQTDVVVKEDADAAFDIADESGRVAFRITSKGHIKTKGFDSENMDIFRATKLDSPQCVCHGYGSVSGQANTIAYFRAGYTAGYRFFECDAINCSDGVPICTHDNNNGLTVYDKTTHEATNVAIASVSGTRTIQMSSSELVDGYTWDSAGNVPIALLSEVIWQVCYFYRCPLHVDGQGLNKASRLAASQYAESLGVGQYVFHELQSGAYTDWDIPCNAIVAVGDNTTTLKSRANQYKKADNNIIFYLAEGATTATIKAFADAAHEVGCYLMSWTYATADAARGWFANGADFIITSNSITNNKI